MQINFNRETLPVLDKCDIVVIGGSFGGVSAALALARAGRKVTLVEPRTYLGREITATLRPWIPFPDKVNPAGLSDVIKECINSSGASAVAGEIPLHMNAVKTCLEDLVLTAGIKLIYASLPVDLCFAQDTLQGVVIGNKSGRQVILCKVLIDATETALVARLAGAKFGVAQKGQALFRYTLEFGKVGTLDETVLSVPDRLGIVNDVLMLHQGYGGRGNVLVEFEYSLPFGDMSGFELTQRDALVQQRTTDLAAYLITEVPAFDQALLAGGSYELYGPHTPQLADPISNWAHLPESVMVNAIATDGTELKTPAVSFSGPIPGIWLLNEAARVAEPMQALIRDPLISSQLGVSLADVINQQWGNVSAHPMKQAAEHNRTGQTQSASLQIKEAQQPQRGRAYDLHPAPDTSIPIICTADTIIVGGGTSGAVAAIVAAQQGIQTVLVEMNPGLGGTGTYGGIHSYWFVRHMGFEARIIDLVNQMQKRLRHGKIKGPIPEWNIEAKARALMQEAQTTGVKMLFNSLVIGTIVEGNVVRGVVVATRTGPVALLGKVIIDASGDGDVAAWAGAEFVYGSERDHSTMYAYMPQVARPGLTRNVKTSMADITNIEDYTRMILAERRRGKKRDHDHGIYLAPRESRHIRGDVVMTFNDQLLRRSWPDTVYVAFSNHDIKGESGSDWLRIGLQPPNLEIEIPYRALLPKGLENILVVGKAYSTTHDGLAAPRMQSDLENLGGVAAIAAALAIRSGQSPRSVNIQDLQKQLVQAGVLPPEILARTLVPLKYTDADIKSMIDALKADPPLYSYADLDVGEHYHGRIPFVDLLCSSPQVVPLLEQAFTEAEGDRQLLMAVGLSMLGSQVGVPLLVSTIQRQLQGEKLPERDSKIRHVGWPPDQAAAPNLANLIYALGLTRSQASLPIWQRVVDLLASVTEDELMDKNTGSYYYVTYVCYGAERLGDPAAVPILKKLHSYPVFFNRVLTSGFQANFFTERMAFLELLICRAMARCGSPDGLVQLINYLNDVRAPLAEHAHTELIAITGKDFGKNINAWSQWLEEEGEKLKPKPWVAPTDPMTTWNEVILQAVSDMPPDKVM